MHIVFSLYCLLSLSILQYKIFLIRLLNKEDELQRLYGEYDKALKSHKSRYWCTMAKSFSHLFYIYFINEMRGPYW